MELSKPQLNPKTTSKQPNTIQRVWHDYWFAPPPPTTYHLPPHPTRNSKDELAAAETSLAATVEECLQTDGWA